MPCLRFWVGSRGFSLWATWERLSGTGLRAGRSPGPAGSACRPPRAAHKEEWHFAHVRTLTLVHAFKVLDVAEREGRPIEAEVQVIAMGKHTAWVGLPGEVFVELGRAIKEKSPFPQTIIVELANGSISYIPDRKGFQEGAYEAISARFSPGGGEKLVEAALKLLGELR